MANSVKEKLASANKLFNFREEVAAAGIKTGLIDNVLANFFGHCTITVNAGSLSKARKLLEFRAALSADTSPLDNAIARIFTSTASVDEDVITEATEMLEFRKKLESRGISLSVTDAAIVDLFKVRDIVYDGGAVAYFEPAADVLYEQRSSASRVFSAF